MGFVGSQYLFGGGSSYDSDAEAFFTATGITDTGIKDAVNQFVLDLKSYSLWSKMVCLYPFVGGSASTHKYNLVNPSDSDGAFRITFNGSWTHDSNGVTGDGSTTYADTHCDISVHAAVDNISVGVYSRTDSTSSQKSWGVYYNGYDSETGVIHPGCQTHLSVASWFLVDIGDLGGSSNRVYYTIGYSDGLLVGTRNSTQLILHSDGSNIAYVSPSGGAFKSGSYMYFGAVNRLDNSSVDSPDDRNYALAFVSSALSDTEHANLYTCVQSLQTALGRNV